MHREPLYTPDGALYASRVPLSPRPLDVTIYDNGGETFDRYTVVFPDGECLGIGDTGNVPNGFCMHVGSVKDGHVHLGPHLGEIIGIEDMTPPARRAVENEWNSYFAT